MSMDIYEAQFAFEAILAEHPDLDASGFECTDHKERIRFLGSEFITQFRWAVAFIDDCRRVTSARTSSYSLKHEAEGHGPSYMSNGALIAAAAYRGIPVDRRAGPNALLPLRAPKPPKRKGGRFQ